VTTVTEFIDFGGAVLNVYSSVARLQ